MRIFLTGGTGFLGSHLVEALLSEGYVLQVSRRASSNMANCVSFLTSVQWVNVEDISWEEEVIRFNPDVIIHAAWIGITANIRDDWSTQLSNIDFVHRLLKVASVVKVKKFISLGSQAEYGEISGNVKENDPVSPVTSYGAVKLCVQRIISVWCADKGICWYWFRIFSVFGERQSEDWFIPSLIRRLLSGERHIPLTAGEQEYAYLYVADFARAVIRAVTSQAFSGIYNLSSTAVLCLKSLGEMIKSEIAPEVVLSWGALPYRTNQSMHIAGDMNKYTHAFGPMQITGLKDSMKKVIDWYGKIR